MIDPTGSFADAYSASLRHLLETGAPVRAVLDPLSPGSRFGKAPRNTREVSPYVLQFANPLACLFLNDARVLRLAYCYGLLLWSLAGSNDVNWLAFYHAGARSFADSQDHLSGAFGHRLMTAQGNQLQVVVDRLREDPTSRRTSCLIMTPEDNFRSTREYPCALATQYLVRNDRLCGFTYMRSQSAAMVLPYDIFLFCGLQNYMAATLQLPAGAYTHFCSSFHIYADELAQTEATIAMPTIAVEVAPMVAGLRLAQLQVYERDLRTACELGNEAPLATTLETIHSPQTFEDEAQLILCAYAALRLDRRGDAIEAIRRLPAGLRDLATKDLLTV